MSQKSLREMNDLFKAVSNLTFVKKMAEENKQLKKELRALKNLLYSIPEFRCNCSSRPTKCNKLRKGVVIKKEVIDLTNDLSEEVVENVKLEVKKEVVENVKLEVVEEEEEEEEEVVEEEEEEVVEVEEEEEVVEEEEVDEGRELEKGLSRREEDLKEIEEVEEEEEEGEEEGEEEVVEEEEEEVEVVEEEEGEEEEAEVFEIEISGVSYYTTDEENGVIYAKTSDDDIGNEVGVFVKGKPKFH